MARHSRRGPSRLFKFMGRKSRTRDFVALDKEEQVNGLNEAATGRVAGNSSETRNEVVASHPWDKHLPVSGSFRTHLKKKRSLNVVWKDEEEGSLVEEESIVEGEGLDLNSLDSGNNCSGEDDLDGTTYRTTSDGSVSSGEEEHSPMSPTSIVDFVSLSPDTFVEDDSSEPKSTSSCVNNDMNRCSSLKPVTPADYKGENLTQTDSHLNRFDDLDDIGEIPSPPCTYLHRVAHEDRTNQRPPTAESPLGDAVHVDDSDQSHVPTGDGNVNVTFQHFAKTGPEAFLLDDEIPFDEVPFDEQLSSCRITPEAKKQPDTFPNAIPAVSKQLGTFQRFGQYSPSSARQGVVLRNFKREKVDGPAVRSEVTACATMRNQYFEEEIPFDELPFDEQKAPVCHAHNFEDKTYFSDDDSLRTEGTNVSIYGEDDDLFGLEFLALA